MASSVREPCPASVLACGNCGSALNPVSKIGSYHGLYKIPPSRDALRLISGILGTGSYLGMGVCIIHTLRKIAIVWLSFLGRSVLCLSALIISDRLMILFLVSLAGTRPTPD